MGAPYSLDLRERVVGAVADGMSCAEAAEQYQVSHSSALRWTRRRAETGSPAALPMGGKKPFALADEEAWIRERVAEKPDITGRELAGGTACAWRGGELLRGLALPGSCWAQLQKKACAPVSRIALTLSGDGASGSSGRARSVLAA